MRTSGRSAVCAMALASMAAVALPAAADASPKKNPKEATFKATLSGSQVSTWEYHRANDKDDPCDASSDGYGDQTIRFDAKRTFRVTFRTPPKNQPDLYGTDGRPVVFATPFRLPVDAKADRNADVTVHTGDIGPPEVCGDNGGADPGYVPPTPDCGVREGGFAASFYFHPQGGDEDDLFVPLPGSTPYKNNLRLEGKDYEWLKADGSDSGGELRNVYERCPFFGDYVEDAGHIYISPAKIKEAKLFDKKRKKLVISGDHESNRTKDDTKSKTILAWNLRLKRIK